MPISGERLVFGGLVSAPNPADGGKVLKGLPLKGIPPPYSMGQSSVGASHCIAIPRDTGDLGEDAKSLPQGDPVTSKSESGKQCLAGLGPWGHSQDSM